MKVLWLALVAASIMAVTNAAEAAPCKGAGSTAAEPIFYYTADGATLDGLDLTLVIGLQPGSDPLADIAKLPSPCVRTTFVSKSRTWTFYGDDDDASPRWAAAPGEKTLYYLAAMPPPDQAHAWAEAQRRRPSNEPSATFKTTIWALVAADGDERRVFGFYDKVPDDARLIEAMQAAIAGRTPTILGFNVKTAKTKESRIFAPATLAVAESQDKETPLDFADPDGVAFARANGGGVRATLSGLTCPPALGELQRSGLFTTGAADGSREIGCRYVSEHMRLAVVETHLKNSESMNNMVTLVLMPLLGQAHVVLPTPPKLPDEWTKTSVELFALLPDGARQGAVLRRSGDWYVEIYALYGGDGEAAVADAFAALAAANGAAPVAP